MIDRQTAIEVENVPYPPISIFAEATTTNGTRILPFKRGAFQGMRTVTPSFFSITSGQISPTYEIVSLIPLMMLLLSSLYFRCGKITILPEFTPTPYMLEKYADKGKDPWMAYAWCVRDVISKYSGYISLDEKLSLKDKKAFEALMNGWVDTAEINGQLFKYDDDKPIQDVKISQPSLLLRKSTITYTIGS